MVDAVRCPSQSKSAFSSNLLCVHYLLYLFIVKRGAVTAAALRVLSVRRRIESCYNMTIRRFTFSVCPQSVFIWCLVSVDYEISVNCATLWHCGKHQRCAAVAVVLDARTSEVDGPETVVHDSVVTACHFPLLSTETTLLQLCFVCVNRIAIMIGWFCDTI